SFTLLVCKGPIRCNSRSGNSCFNCGNLACASCTLFSPNRRWPACKASRMPSWPTVLLTATNRVLGAGAIAVFRAASMRVRMAARFSGMLMSGGKLARDLGRLKSGLLVLMTDDEWLPDPLAAAHRLPKGSVVIVRARNAERRHALAESLRTKTSGLILLASDDPILADCLHGLHLPERRAREAAHWRAVRPSW